MYFCKSKKCIDALLSTIRKTENSGLNIFLGKTLYIYWNPPYHIFVSYIEILFFVCIASKFHVKYQWEILRLIMVVINLSMFNNVTHTLHSHHAPHCHHSYCSRVLHWRLFPGLCQTDDCRCMTFTEGEDGSRNQKSSTLSAQGKTFMTKKAKGRKKKTEP